MVYVMKYEYVSTYVRTYIIHITSVYMYIYTYVHIYIYVYIRTYVYIYIHTYTYAHDVSYVSLVVSLRFSHSCIRTYVRRSVRPGGANLPRSSRGAPTCCRASAATHGEFHLMRHTRAPSMPLRANAHKKPPCAHVRTHATQAYSAFRSSYWSLRSLRKWSK